MVSTLLGTVQEVIVGQFGPVKTIIAVEGSKLLPLTVNENEPVVTVVGEMLLIDGVGLFAVIGDVFEIGPPEPF